MQDGRTWIILYGTGIFLQTDWQEAVIVTHADHIIAGTMTQAYVPVIYNILCPAVLFILKESYPGIIERLHDTANILWRGIIHNNKLKFAISLRQA